MYLMYILRIGKKLGEAELVAFQCIGPGYPMIYGQCQRCFVLVFSDAPRVGHVLSSRDLIRVPFSFEPSRVARIGEPPEQLTGEHFSFPRPHSLTRCFSSW